MAEEKSDASVNSEKTGSSKKLVILIFLGICLLGGGGGAAWFLMGSGMAKPAPESAEEKLKESAHLSEPGPIMELDPFVLNLADREDLRYLKMTIKIELDRPEAETDFQSKLPAIRDSLLVLLTSKESQTLRTVNGKRRVREEIMARVNRVMDRGQVTKVFSPILLFNSIANKSPG